jgi:hypothetical protein
VSLANDAFAVEAATLNEAVSKSSATTSAVTTAEFVLRTRAAIAQLLHGAEAAVDADDGCRARRSRVKGGAAETATATVTATSTAKPAVLYRGVAVTLRAVTELPRLRPTVDAAEKSGAFFRYILFELLAFSIAQVMKRNAGNAGGGGGDGGGGESKENGDDDDDEWMLSTYLKATRRAKDSAPLLSEVQWRRLAQLLCSGNQTSDATAADSIDETCGVHDRLRTLTDTLQTPSRDESSTSSSSSSSSSRAILLHFLEMQDPACPFRLWDELLRNDDAIAFVESL